MLIIIYINKIILVNNKINNNKTNNNKINNNKTNNNKINNTKSIRMKYKPLSKNIIVKKNV